MANYENENALAKTCLENLRQAIGPALPIRLGQPAARGHDFNLEIGTNPHLKLAVEVKRRIATRNQALHIILQLRKDNHADAMVFADWVPEPVAEELRKAGIFFVDAQGNVFIRRPPQVVVDIRGKKPERPLKAEPGRLIEPAGLKVIHYLLTHPEAVGAPLRTIGQGADVALGTMHVVIKELKREQWLLPAKKKGRRFGDVKGLVELFVRGYALKLRPTCLLGRYRHKMRAPQEILRGFAKRLAGLEGRWAVTNGMAARELTRHLEPDRVTIFVDDQARAKLEQEPMLRDETGGNVTLLRLFGEAAVADKRKRAWPLATPLLIYAELLETGGAREVETARMIYERFIEPKIKHG